MEDINFFIFMQLHFYKYIFEYKSHIHTEIVMNEKNQKGRNMHMHENRNAPAKIHFFALVLL